VFFAAAGAYLAFSRSTIIAAGLTVLVAASLRYVSRTRVAAAFVLALVLLLCTPEYRTRLASLADVTQLFSSGRHSQADGALKGRATEMGAAALVVADHPVLGVGLGGFERAYAARTGLKGDEPKRAASHTTPVTVAAETGLPGLALFGWLLAVPLTIGFRRASGSFAGRASLIVALVVLAIGVHSLFYDAFFEDPMTWGALGLGALVASWRGLEASAPKPPTPGRRRGQEASPAKPPTPGRRRGQEASPAKPQTPGRRPGRLRRPRGER
jgi:hypothetical protein